MLALLFKLLIGHALGDFTLQPDVMARGKNRNLIPQAGESSDHPSRFWPYWLTSHALVHGGIVWMATGRMELGLAETVLHWIIDFAKCENWTNLHSDQGLHLTCKLGYVGYFLIMGIG